jgi:hypothetical protein
MVCLNEYSTNGVTFESASGRLCWLLTLSTPLLFVGTGNTHPSFGFFWVSWRISSSALTRAVKGMFLRVYFVLPKGLKTSPYTSLLRSVAGVDSPRSSGSRAYPVDLRAPTRTGPGRDPLASLIRSRIKIDKLWPMN